MRHLFLVRSFLVEENLKKDSTSSAARCRSFGNGTTAPLRGGRRTCESVGPLYLSGDGGTVAPVVAVCANGAPVNVC